MRSSTSRFHNKKVFLSLFVGLFSGLALSIAYASLTLTSNSITGDSSFNTITGAASTTLDVGASTLSLQTTNNGPIKTGTGLFTIQGPLTQSGGVVSLVSTTITGQATTTNLSITGIGTSTANYLTVNVSGVVNATTTLNTTVLQGVSVSSTAPSTNQVLTYNGNSWAPAAASGAVLSTADQGGFYACLVAPPSSDLVGTQSIVLSTTEVRACQVVIPFTITVRRVSGYVSNAVTSTQCDIGIYNASGTLLWHAPLNTSSTGAVTATSTGVTLSPAVYWTAWTCSGSASVGVFGLSRTWYQADLIQGNGASPEYATGASAVSAGTLNASLGTLTGWVHGSTNLPAFYFQP